MSNSIFIAGFMEDLNDLIREPEPNKKTLEHRIKKLFESFCNDVLTTQNHKDLIEEARQFYDATMENLDTILDQLKTHTLQDIGGRFS